MLISMTGFGSDVYEGEGYTLQTEIKSLNNRFLDISIKLPKEVYSYEYLLRDLVKKELNRGKINVNINLTKFNNFENNFNFGELEKTVLLLKKIKEKTGIDEELNLNHILAFKESFINEQDNNNFIPFEIFAISLKNSIVKLKEMKYAEGLALEKDLLLRIENISLILDEIELLSKTSTNDFFERFKERSKKLVEDYIEDVNRFHMELAIISERQDITEECVRLRSHINLFKEIINSTSDAGRKLNFLCQEINREANTINSKTISSEISHKGIVIKEELEKIREQIQNIE